MNGIQAADLARRHWEKRWHAPRLDHWMVGHLSAPDVALVVDRLNARHVLEIGPGSFRFARGCRAAGVAVSCVELPMARAASHRPPDVPCWFSWRSSPLPWPTQFFDVAYQRNALPNLPSAAIPAALDELARVARVLVWAGDLRPRFWCGRNRPGGERAAWMLAEIGRRFGVERAGRKILILWPRREAVA